MEYRIDVLKLEEKGRAIDIWEASVRATHGFVLDSDIVLFRRQLEALDFSQWVLRCARPMAGSLESEAVAMMCVRENKLDMLFVHPAHFQRGIGYRLLQHAVEELGATHLDVNEQNHKALAFYRRFGFAVIGRSERDGSGKPYPLLHMALENASR
jgi:putative acetyltransferase